MNHQMTPQHINATTEDISGNQGLGRYIFLTGSDGRAREISERFQQVNILPHPRQHNIYTGFLSHQGQHIDVAAVSTGMGGPSADIIINELIMLGAKRMLRIGTAGSMQDSKVAVGDLVVATAAVRDDKASWDYIHKEYPAIASLEYLNATKKALSSLQNTKAHFGIVHSKSSLYAREFGGSFMNENEEYMASLRQAGVLASEMESAQLFVLSSLMSARNNQSILSGCILSIIGDCRTFSDNKGLISSTIDKAIELAIETTRALFSSEST